VEANYQLLPSCPYHNEVRVSVVRPGPHKIRRLPVGERRACQLLQCVDYGWRELFEKADVVSEGAIREDAEGPVYYGSTSLLLAWSLQGGSNACSSREQILRLLRVDPHARLRAVRIACLEAQLRARRAIGSVRAELAVRPDVRGVRIDIDVEAPISQNSTARKSRSAGTRRPDR
jgi:hypothetical protein